MDDKLRKSRKLAVRVDDKTHRMIEFLRNEWKLETDSQTIRRAIWSAYDYYVLTVLGQAKED